MVSKVNEGAGGSNGVQKNVER